MNCRKIAAALSAYIDGEVTPGKKAQVETHLDECRECRARCERLKETDGFLAVNRAAVTVPFFENRLFERIRQKENAARPFLDLIRIEKKLIVAFSALLVILAAVAYNRHLIVPSGTYTELQSYVAGSTASSAVTQVASSNEIVSYLIND